ncbi:hypothetical protein CDL12_10554 [Handroanthus impetiginosus]|uniref:Secreted protein n=1 Tax=Handroanthus impetiginosus TaxID=429701 RepID=A0A2G9HGW7_9LAMI|nr:hypothetical protein CDL12_10554 [Handroanthus impetiginosus]
MSSLLLAAALCSHSSILICVDWALRSPDGTAVGRSRETSIFCFQILEDGGVVVAQQDNA